MKKKIIITSLFIFAFVLFTACAPAEKPLDNNGYDNNGYDNNYDNNYNNDMNDGLNDPYTNNDDYNNNNMNNTTRPNNTNNNGIDRDINQTKNDVEDLLESKVKQINGVSDAVVVVDGNTAYCGVDASQANANLSSLRQKISRQIRATNPAVSTVYVTTDKTSMSNLSNYRTSAAGSIEYVKSLFQ